MNSNITTEKIQPRLINREAASEYVGGRTVLQKMLKDGLKPVIRQHRLTRFDKQDLDFYINKKKLEVFD